MAARVRRTARPFDDPAAWVALRARQACWLHRGADDANKSATSIGTGSTVTGPTTPTCTSRSFRRTATSSEANMTSPLGPDSGLFAGTAWHYARYRPGYPKAFVDDLVTGLSLDGRRRLLDLGCGTGQLTIPLAPHVAEAVGMDPEPEMLTEAAKSARSAGITNVTWAQGNSADLPGDFGRFLLVIMGRSFHWMDREQVLASPAAEGRAAVPLRGTLSRRPPRRSAR